MEVLLKSASMVTATLEQQITRYGNVGLVTVLVLKKVGGMPPDGTGVDRNQGHVHGCREEFVFRELDQKFPDKLAADRVGEAMEETSLTITKMRLRRLSLDDQDMCLPVFRRKRLTCRHKPEAASFCVEVDTVPWVELRSCLRHAEAGSCLKYARRSERRFLVVHKTGGRMEHSVCMNWRTEFRMSLRITWTRADFESEIEAVVATSWNPLRKAMQVEVLANWRQTRAA